MASITSPDRVPPALQDTTQMRATSAEELARRTVGARPVAAERVDGELIRSVLGGIGGGVLAALMVLVSSIAIAVSRGLDPFTAPKLFVLGLVGKTAMLPGLDLTAILGTVVLFYAFAVLGGALGFVTRYLPLSIAVPMAGIAALLAWLIQRLAVWPAMPDHFVAHYDAFIPPAASFLQMALAGLTIGVGILLSRVPIEYFRPGRNYVTPTSPLSV